MSNHWLQDIRLILFDLDGTLYEETAHFDYYAGLLGESLPPERRAGYLADYEAMKQGRHPLRVGVLYDAERDLVLRVKRGRVLAAWRWDGQAVPEADVGSLYPGAVESDRRSLLNVGDLWWAPPAIARHWGQERYSQETFLQVRRYMMSPEFQMRPVPGLREALTSLRPRYRLVMATNSPAEDSTVILQKVGLDGLFDLTSFMTNKPAGIPPLLRRLEAEFGLAPAEILSVGDNLINEILPCRELGCRTVFIDPHGTRLLEAEPDWDLAVESIRDLIPLLQEVNA